ncbi:hypothetical protein FD754_020696, partial [Muntiacus muntjak]
KTQCDAILMVQERKIPAHCVVFAAAIHFFNLKFTTNKLESNNNLHCLLDAANQYQIEPVKKTCADFLKEQIDASNLQAEPLIQDNPKCLKMVISKLP